MKKRNRANAEHKSSHSLGNHHAWEVCVRQSVDFAITTSCKVSILIILWRSRLKLRKGVITYLWLWGWKLELALPPQNSKATEEKQIQTQHFFLFPRWGPCQGHRHGQRPLLPSSATCHPVGNSTGQLPWIPVTEFSQRSPWASHTHPLLFLYCKNLPTHQKFSHHHLCAYTLGHKYCKVQHHPVVFQPTHLLAL